MNHGVPEVVMKNMMGIAKEFFEIPVEDRACLYSEDLAKDPHQEQENQNTLNAWISYAIVPYIFTIDDH